MEIQTNYKISLDKLGQTPSDENIQERKLIEEALKNIKKKLSNPELSDSDKQALIQDYERLNADYDELSMSPTFSLSKSELIFIHSHTS